jgi:glycosyltransferase involved in cell wall biosynthesis
MLGEPLLKILFLHRTGQLGDRIRATEILNFLKEGNYDVIEASLPLTSVNMDQLINALPYFIPLSGFSSLSVLENMTSSFAFNVSYNYLNRIITKSNFQAILAETSWGGWLALQLIKKRGLSIPLIVDVHGLWFAEAKGWGKKNWKQIEYVEAELFQSSDHLIVVSERMKSFLIEHFKVVPEKVTVIPNGAPAIFHVTKYQLPLKIIYAGIFDYYENVDRYLEIAENSKSNDFRFFLFGAGPLKKKILSRLKKRNIPIQYMGYVPRGTMLNLLAEFQVGMIFSSKDLAREVACPIKLMDYASRGLPTIGPKIGDWGDLIAAENIGFALEDDSSERYSEALSNLLDEHEWNKKSQNCLDFAETYQWHNVLRPMKEVLDKF